MKNSMIWFLAAAAIGSTVCVVEARRVATTETRLASLNDELKQKAQQIETLQAEQTHVQLQREDAESRADALAAQLQARAKPAETNDPVPPPAAPPPDAALQKAPGEQGGLGQTLSKMMQDPNMKQFIREQQRQIMNQLYAPLIKQMRLSPEEAGKFKDLITDHMMSSAEKATALLGSLSNTNRADTFKAMAAEEKDREKAMEDQLKGLLGDTRFAQYKDFQETAAERTQLNLFRQQLGGDENGALGDQQVEQLLILMKEEKKNLANTPGMILPGQGGDEEKLDLLLSEEKSTQAFKSIETLNQRVYERARLILSPEQLQAFGKFQAGQVSQLRMSLSMARTFMGGEKPQAAAPPAQ